jgi:hypothetical protein
MVNQSVSQALFGHGQILYKAFDKDQKGFLATR